MKFTHVLFDLDGTLTDPGMGITNSVMYSLKKFGITPPKRRELYSFIGPPLVNSFMTKYGFDEEKARLAVTYYREYFSEYGMFENVKYDGIDGLLSGLKKDGVILSVATSKPDLFTLKILEKFGLAKYFDFVAANTMDETRSDKKSVIKYALDSLSVKPSDKIAMVGDRKYDIEGGKSNGIYTVGVSYGYGSKEELTEAGADALADSVEELSKILL